MPVTTTNPSQTPNETRWTSPWRKHLWINLGERMQSSRDRHRRCCDKETRSWRCPSTLRLLPCGSISRYVQTSTSAICCRFVLTMRTSATCRASRH
ncbi:hypothetical protein JG688_00005183 [Phytophthora aleatoria]|uniref:Uncharacterized protein n=1 Tax=Phytophthora aleatoria TaxID=2496075 RepID=A0A8J5J175_9STRA|nr:hypothetical protein JG688_00005183 [Phytophthora aleatoria]